MVAWRHGAVRAERKSPLSVNEPSSLALAERIAAAAADKLATDIVLLDMREVVSYTDWLVIMTARSDRQARAVAEEIQTRLKQEDRTLPQRTEGEREGTWILLDYLDVVAHVFVPESREFYRLDRLWGQVPTVEYAS